MLNLNVLKIRQRETNLYITIMKASDLLRYSSIDWWREDNLNGYQRPLQESRINKAARYILDEEGIFPTSVLVNIRGQIEFIPVSHVEDYGELGILQIPFSSLPFWVIDGQHRLMAARVASKEDIRMGAFALPITIVNLEFQYDEMRMFYIVNSRQKSVPTGLAQRHLDKTITIKGEEAVRPFETKKKVLAAKAIPIVDVVRTHPSSPWYDKVKLPSDRRTSKKYIISQTSFADSIGYILKDISGEELEYIRKNPKELGICIVNYWNAIKEIYPDAFKQPKNYTIQKTHGCYVFHIIFNKFYEICRKCNDFSKETFNKLLSTMLTNFNKCENENAMDSEFWNSKTGTPLGGMKMAKELAERFKKYIEEDLS